MAQSLRVLLLEDNPDDALLVLRALRQGGFEPDCRRVDSEADFAAALDPALDVILSDFELPQFDGLRALRLVRERGLDVPFLLVSGAIGEERAVAAMKEGAADYLIKDRLTRLGPAVAHAIEQNRLRRDRQRAVEALRDSEARYRQLLAGLPVAVCTTDADGYLTLFNAAAEAIWGRRPELGRDRWCGSLRMRRPDGSPLPPDEGPMAGTLRTGQARPGEEIAIERPDGSVAALLVYPTPLHDAEGRVTGAMNVLVDISARKAMEADLRDSHERFREVVETIRDVFWISDGCKETPGMRYVSPGFEVIWGRSCEELYARPGLWLESVYSVDRERVAAALREKECRGTYDETYRIVRPDGTLRWVHDKAFPVRDAGGRVTRVVGLANDITESKTLEDQFLHAQRLEAIGTLAGGVAHDLNNILAPVVMAAALLRDGTRDARDERLLGMIEQSAQRGADVIRQLLTFSRGGEGERVQVQPRYMLKEMAAIVAETFPREISMQLDIDPHLPSVTANPTQIQQVLMNLCVNARDAMPSGGQLTLHAHRAVVTEEEAQRGPGRPAGRFVMLAVEDTGTGMPAEVRRRLFEPFFTTKPAGKGTGLGLVTVQSIVKSHGGFLHVESEPGRGTTFQVYWPASDEAPVAVERPAEIATPGGGRLVLVVDDEPSVLAAENFVFVKQGYRTLQAHDGEEALRMFDEHRAEIAVVLTDVMMPVLGGVELVRALRTRRPDIPIVATTGMTADDKREELRAAGVGEILDKPCSAQELLAAVQRVLRTSPGPA